MSKGDFSIKVETGKSLRELRELTDSALTKLCAMTDEDFAQLELYPDFDQ